MHSQNLKIYCYDFISQSSTYNTSKNCLRKVLYWRSPISLGFHEISTAQWMPGCNIFFCRGSSCVSYSFFFELMKKYCICANADTSTSFRVVFFSHLLQEISLLLLPVFSFFIFPWNYSPGVSISSKIYSMDRDIFFFYKTLD